MGTVPVAGGGAAASVDLSVAIEHWVADGIITAEQATRMRADLAESLTVPLGGLPAAVPRTSRAALVTEALGYLGGVIILVAVGLVVGNLSGLPQFVGIFGIPGGYLAWSGACGGR